MVGQDHHPPGDLLQCRGARYRSDLYQDACRHCQGVALAQVIIVEGLAP